MTHALLLCVMLAADPAAQPVAAVTPTAEKSTESPKRDPSKDVFSDAAPPIAPDRSTPWLKSPFIFIAQFLAGVGARASLVPLWCVPVVGPPVAVLLTPVMESVAITYVGDRMGDGRAPLVAPLFSSVVFSGTAAVLTALAALGVGALAAGWVSLVIPSSPTADLVRGMPMQTLVGATAGMLAGLGGMLVVGALLTAVSPVASVALYQFIKRRKPKGDNGTDLFSLFTRPPLEEPQPPPSPPKANNAPGKTP